MIDPKKTIIGTELFSGSRTCSYNVATLRKFFLAAKKKNILQVDTAPSYGVNNSVERLIGKSLLRIRKKFIISSKFVNNIDLPIEKRIKNIKKNLDNTLKNLKTNYIDNLFFHSGNNKDFIDDEIWKYLNTLKKKKKN